MAARNSCWACSPILLDDAAEAGGRLVAVDAPGRLADVDGEVGGALDLGDILSGGDDRRRSVATGACNASTW